MPAALLFEDDKGNVIFYIYKIWYTIVTNRSEILP